MRPSARLYCFWVLSIAARVIDRCVPDSLLRFYMNLLDKRVPPKVISAIIRSHVSYIPQRFVTLGIIALDEYVPDTVANSRKVCAVLAGLGKYIPDEAIPPGSEERWENVKLRFHVPTLIIRGRPEGPAGD